MSSIGNRLKTARENLKLSQEMMAKDLGISARILREYEKSSVPMNSNILLKLHGLYGINPNYLILNIGEEILSNEATNVYVDQLKEKYNLEDKETEKILKELINSNQPAKQGIIEFIEFSKINKQPMQAIGKIFELLSTD